MGSSSSKSRAERWYKETNRWRDPNFVRNQGTSVNTSGVSAGGRGGFGVPGRGGFGMPGRGGMIPGQAATGPFGPIIDPGFGGRGFGGPGGGGMGFGANGSHADDMTVLGGRGSGSQRSGHSFTHGSGSSRRSRSVAPEEHRSHRRRNTQGHASSRSGRHPSESLDPHLSGIGQGLQRRGRRSTLSEGRPQRFDSQFG